MEKQTLNYWYEFLSNQDELVRNKRREIMESLHTSLTQRVGRKGWERKGNGGVTQSMVNSEIAKYQFMKNYNGTKVTISLNVHIHEKYGRDGYKEITVSGGRSMIGQDAWWPRKEGSNFQFEKQMYNGELTDKFYLEKLLDDLDRVNS